MLYEKVTKWTTCIKYDIEKKVYIFIIIYFI